MIACHVNTCGARRQSVLDSRIRAVMSLLPVGQPGAVQASRHGRATGRPRRAR